MRDAMIQFLILSNPFRRFPHKKVALFLHKNYKELKNHHFFTNPTNLNLLNNPWVSINFQKFAKKMWKHNVKSLIFHQFSWGKKPTCRKIFPLYKQPDENYGKSILQVPDTGTQVLDNTRPFLCSSIVSFWITLACSKERKYHIFGQYWYTKNVPVLANTGTFQYLGPEVYFFQNYNQFIDLL